MVSAAAVPRHRRVALIVGVANARSIAWHCASSLTDKGYDVVLTYMGERFGKAVRDLADRVNTASGERAVSAPTPGRILGCLPCDVNDDDNVRRLFEELLPPIIPRPRLDAVVHSVAHAPADAMKGGTLLGTTAEAFSSAHATSAHSLIAIARHGLPLLSASGGATDAADSEEEREEGMEAPLPPSSSVVALTYLGSSRAVPNYNVMGPAKASLEATVRGLALELGPPPHRVRFNALSAGPVNTLAARGIRDFTEMRRDAEARSMLRRNVTAEEVAETAAFLAGEGSSGITGQTIYVDGGYSAVAGPVL